MTAEMQVTRTQDSRLEKVDLDNPGFGVTFSDHMFEMNYLDGEWQTPEIVPYGSIDVAPAMASLHYGQAVFEGMKAFYSEDGDVHLFRPEQHHERFNASCRRLCIPETDYETFIEAIKTLISLDYEWIPKTHGQALYIRPFIFATDNYLAVAVSETYKFLIITSPVGAYYKEGINPVGLVTAEEYSRTAKGGVGTVKTLGNYAASLLPAKKAKEKGFTQVLWLDAAEKKYVEEVGTMNIFFKIDGTLVTPPLEGTILPGVTRDSVIRIAREWDTPVEERQISIDEVMERSDNGELEEVFGTGTAAVISPVGKIQHRDKTISINGHNIGPFAKRLYDEITGIQYGNVEDRFGWIRKVEPETW
ncbi:MAG: branched-chain amino acid aminotransferase [Candidatus Marinimicrobia bacterium]|nr:branched-chain amino acid aminotransferase [Candidatus Neomarinimicrobiota bacterium]MCF7828669.1 branched-chain amino acid aminotransferase [Candidatus Neomarinimicrobiota bacterium]MCF7880410.1 branched-chain amino acid aminotransferase [Candidatus Neomarinimicrobiota bacterium]